MDVTFITSNAEKAAQIGRHLDHALSHAALEIPEIQSLDVTEVATHKAHQAYAQLGTPVLVDDTALTFHALGGLPGPLIKWFLGALGNDGLCTLLDAYPDRTARAVVCFAFCDESGVQHFSGSVSGSIADAPRGEEGFGWDPIFIPEGYDETWGEMDVERQRETCMRRSALRKLQRGLDARERTSS